ncbi:hypothetical protein HYV73_03875 [Candidatus Uhrbacteria bacterium]|nr:hypothetical protein [Candidatus Uhrbacteria bacterium]
MNQEQAVIQTLTAILSLQKEFGSMQKDIKSMQGDIGTIQKTMATKQDIQELKKDIQTVKSDVQALKSDVQTLKGDVLSVQSDVLTITRESRDTLKIVQFLKDKAVSQDELKAKDAKVITMVDMLVEKGTFTSKDRKRIFA